MSENNPTSKHKQLARLLDSKFRIPGTNITFGIDPIIGLLPGIGDWIGGLASLYFLIYAVTLQAKASVILRMLLNILIDIIIGAIPLLGEIFDVGWKANLRNADLLEDLIHNPDQTERQSKIVVWSICIFAIALVFALLYLIGSILIYLIELIM
jgi:NAD/NADP transhydrogenase beta subunit